MLDWLYGSRLPEFSPATGLMLRNLTTDVDTLIDVAKEIPHIVERTGMLIDGVANVTAGNAAYDHHIEYRLRDRELSEDEVRELGVSDRSQLHLHVKVEALRITEVLGSAERIGQISVVIMSPNARIHADGDATAHAQRLLTQVADYLYSNSTQRPDWNSARWIWWLLPIPIALAAWIWTALTIPLPLPAHLLILATLSLASVSSITRARSWALAGTGRVIQRNIQYRGESRKETQQRRADSRRDLKVAGLSILGTLIAAAITALATGILTPTP